MLSIIRKLHAALLVVVGLVLMAGGVYLIGLGGSFYYAPLGFILSVSGVLSWRGDQRGVWVYLTLLVATTIWAVWEVGLSGWALAPRLVFFMVLGAWFFIPWHRQGLIYGDLKRNKSFTFGLSTSLVLGVVGSLYIRSADPILPPFTADVSQSPVVKDFESGDGQWLDYSGSDKATHFATLDQIQPGNVEKLRVAWTYRTGDVSDTGSASSSGFQNTPLAVGNRLFVCTPTSMVDALDADTGERIWRFNPQSDNPNAKVVTCRGVGYAQTSFDLKRACAQRLLLQTGDARLIAIDALNGEKCSDFGNNGEVSLLDGMGDFQSGHIGATSPPLIVGRAAVVGNQIFDNDRVGEPSGVIRAFDIETGRMLWAWDMGRPGQHDLPPKGQSFTRSTPNSWGVLTADSALGLVYVPLGNQTPDFYGANRLPESEQYSASVTALDIKTGEPRWTFQTVHHDIWDYDLPVGPTLVDWKVQGADVPAVVISTKRGEFFVLDRRNGKPLSPVEERAVPHGDPLPGEQLSKTQPYSPEMPQLNTDPITEKQMWGMSPIDQLQCRILFRSLRYEGQFTPLSTQGSLYDPGPSGVMNWGGVSVDEGRRLMMVNSNRMPFVMTAIPRVEANALGVLSVSSDKPKEFDGYSAMSGTPYAVKTQPFLSFAHIPCLQPPWGYMQAINLDTKQTIWKRPLGTGRDTGPFGLKVGPPLELGVFTQGGSVATMSGLTFIGSTVDRYLRAIDSRTGRELWKDRLPAGGQANPMTFRSPSTGKQYVVIAAGGHASLETKRGDYLVAYALPD